MPSKAPLRFRNEKLLPGKSGKAEQMRGCLWGTHLKGWMALRWKRMGEAGKGMSMYTYGRLSLDTKGECPRVEWTSGVKS